MSSELCKGQQREESPSHSLSERLWARLSKPHLSIPVLNFFFIYSSFLLLSNSDSKNKNCSHIKILVDVNKWMLDGQGYKLRRITRNCLSVSLSMYLFNLSALFWNVPLFSAGASHRCLDQDHCPSGGLAFPLLFLSSSHTVLAFSLPRGICLST